MNSELIRDGYPCARKEYECIWCDEYIMVKEKHYYCVFKFDGNVYSNRFHIECKKASSSMDRQERLVNQNLKCGSYIRGTKKIKDHVINDIGWDN